MSETNNMNEALKSFSMPAYEQIPDVGLYLDQVAKFINSFLTAFPEMTVTPSMISNYAKQKLISRINKKTYNRQQIAALIMIALSKTVISIDHVKQMLEELRQTDETLEEAYTLFAKSLAEMLHSLADNDSFTAVNAGNDTDRMMRNIVIAIAHKMYLEKYFENRAE
ncbi:MAG: DUF1836 domain-containing protein [Erysipelotrichaceae bacterium]|nr:DUF1836 domain-containing protein [Erysipelotrichaceae bacterium]